MSTPPLRHPPPQADPISFRRRLIIAVLLPLLLVAILAGLFLWQISRLLDATRWVEHTDEVISQANITQKLLIDLETGLRGYLITGEREFLEPYERAAQQINPAFDSLSRLVSDNPPQGERLDAIRPLYMQWMSYAREVFALKDSGGEYEVLVRSGEGKRRMDAMRAQFATFIETEERLRNERTRGARQATRLAVGTGSASS